MTLSNDITTAKNSFRNQKYANETSLSKYTSEMKDKNNIAPNLMQRIVNSKRCMLCLHEKYEILNYPDHEELLDKMSELVSKCQHFSKFLLSNYKSNN